MKDKKEFLQKAIELEAKEIAELKADFKTYKQAIDEIYRLKYVVNGLNFKIEQLIKAQEKQKRGRPKKKQSFFDVLFGYGSKPSPKKGGAPVKYSLLDSISNLKEWDDTREKIANEKGISLHKCTDKYLVEHILKKDLTLSRAQRTEYTRKIRSAIKQMRDKTGIRTRKRNPKQKTP